MVSRTLNALYRLHWYHWLILSLSLVLTLSAWMITGKQTKEKIELQFNQQIQQSLTLIDDRMKNYEDILWAGAATIQVLGGEIDRNQWKKYYENLDIEQKYPGINGVGVIHYVPPYYLESYLAEQKKLMPEYAIHPPHNKNDYWPITYIEPQQKNIKAVGLDMAHENNRYIAAKKAQKTASTQITGPIILVQDENQTPGFLFYSPFYKDGKSDTKQQRDENFIGLVYAPFVVSNLLKGTLGQDKRHFGIRISDGNEIIYDENFPTNDYYDVNAVQQKTVTKEMYGRSWSFYFRSNILGSEFKSQNQPLIILISGILINLLLLGIFLVLANANKRAVDYANKMTEELEESNSILEKEIIEKKRLVVESKQATQAKSNFLSNMSHELRTPLTAVIGFINMCLKTDLDSNQKYILNNAKLASDTLITLINHTLDYSKIESGNLEIIKKEFDLVESLDKIYAIFSTEAKQKEIDFSINIEPNFPTKIVGDILRIEQILINLTGNAFKFTDEGEVSINVNFELIDEDSINLLIKVKDTGIGIEHEKLNELFESFNQIDNSATRSYGGTGLGLAISKELVYLMDGQMKVTSYIDRGSQFSFELTLQTPNQDELYSKAELHKHFSFYGLNRANQPIPTSIYEHTTPLEGLKILVVEDTQFNQIIAQAMLEELGASVTIVNHGQEALELLENESEFSLILMDIQMPIMDGYETTKNILDNDKLNHIPIIAMTANAIMEDVKMCLNAGMKEHIAKPVNEKELVEKILKHVSSTNIENTNSESE